MGGGLPKSKLIETLKSTVGYDNGMGYGREFREWPNDNPFTTTSFAPLTTESDKVTQTQTAMLEVFQWLRTSTLKPILSAISTMMPSTTSSPIVTDRDEWGNSVETYRVDEPPHSPGWSLECRIELFPSINAVALFICGLPYYLCSLRLRTPAYASVAPEFPHYFLLGEYLFFIFCM